MFVHGQPGLKAGVFMLCGLMKALQLYTSYLVRRMGWAALVKLKLWLENGRPHLGIIKDGMAST